MTKGLEAIKDIKENLNNIDNEYGFNLRFEIEEIKDDCKIIVNELKSLEIIIEKQVDMELFNRCKSSKEYNYSVGFSIANRDLTEEEFNLLKELENVRKN